MIIEIPNENSIIKWKNNDKDEWKVAEISDLIKAYERPQSDLISRSEAEKLGATCLAKRNENGQLEAIISLENAPTVEIPNYGGQVVPDTLQGWRYEERPQGELKEYKPLEVDYNVKSAVENLKTAYWSNDTEKYAKAFTEADQMIVSAICHYGYIVVKGGAE